jgi:hypothetical protein
VPLFAQIQMMKASVVALALLENVNAFSAPTMRASSSKVAMSYENELGVIAPTGFFDPLNLSADIDAETFAAYRTAELKHGRVAQLAVVGFVVPEIFRFPGEIAPGVAFADIPNGVGAISAVPALGWLQMFFLIGAVDYYGFLGNFDAGKPSLDAEELERRQLSELQHGRLAMLATLELLRHSSQNLVVPGFDGLDNLITGLPFLYN